MTLHHDGTAAPIELRAALSVSLALHEPITELVTLRGVWAEETRIRRARLGTAPILLQSRTGKTGFDAQPYAALLSEDAVTLCELDWSGNWRMDIAPDSGGALLSGGLNPWRLRHRLLPGTHLALPRAIFGRIAGDLNRATQALHNHRRAGRPDPDRPIPVQFNSWYPYFGEPTAATMLALVPRAHRLGCEIFVVDAGWYRPDQGESTEDWEARTGDWRTSRTRFPNGLREISDACHTLGMQFGLWFEPEAVGRLSALRTEHPDWLHWIDGHAPTDPHRAIIHLGVPAARTHVLDRLSRVIKQVGVDWVKWDFNNDLGPGGWAPGLPPALTAQDPVIAHVEGLYAVLDALRARFPDLTLEMCAAGAGRMDGGILAHAHTNWISDQPSALRKLAIHFGSQLAHPAVACNDWLVQWPPGIIPGYDDDSPDLANLGDLAFRLHVAMLGSFGISARIDRWSDPDSALVAAHVKLYRDQLRRIIHHGDQYLLTPRPRRNGGGDWAAIWYVAKDGSEGALFAFRLGGADTSRRYPLPGLREGPATATAFPNRPVDVTDGAVTITRSRMFRSRIVLVQAG
jgi:alpha-galactosidase